MAKQALTNAGVFINGLDQSNYTHSLSVSAEREEIDITGLGDEYRQGFPGNEFLSVELEMYWGNQLVDETLRTAYDTGASVIVQIQPGYGGITPANPMWEADCIVVHYQAFGDVGEATPTSVSLRSTGEYDVQTAEQILFLPYGVSVIGP